MAQSVTRQPSVPDAADRARSIAARRGPASIAIHKTRDGALEPCAPALRHAHPDGSLSLLFSAAEAPAPCAVEASQLATVELIDLAPVDLREPTRGLVWLTGWLHTPADEAARARAIEIAASDPDPCLLDTGHGASLLVLRPLVVVLADGEGCRPLPVPRFAAARPDPFSRYETSWLAHLEADHPDVLSGLAHHLPEASGRLRPLGLDRLGLRLRVEGEAHDCDTRLAFERVARSPRDLTRELRRLLACPHPAGGHALA